MHTQMDSVPCPRTLQHMAAGGSNGSAEVYTGDVTEMNSIVKKKSK